jgi:hypothetical protein
MKSSQTNRRIRRTVGNLGGPWCSRKSVSSRCGLDEVTVANDDQAKKDFYARAFQEWAEGNIDGTAQEIFDAVTAILEGD